MSNNLFIFDDSKTILKGIKDKSIESIIIPNNVTSIGRGVFAGCRNLSSIILPDSVTTIGEYAFEQCFALLSIRLPKSLTRIEESAFYRCTGLASIIIPDSVTYIGDDAFGGCSNLTSINIPANVMNIGDRWGEGNPFAYCSNLSLIKVATANQNYESRNNCNAIIEKKSNKLIAGCKNSTIPKDIRIIGKKAFCGTGITSIYIPESVEKIQIDAFRGCSYLSSIIVDSSNPKYDSRDNSNAIVEKLTNKLVVGCKNTIIPDSVTSIGTSAFRGCKSLTHIDIPNSVINLGKYAFDACVGLTSIDIPNSITDIDEWIFTSCKSLRFVDLPNSVMKIGSHAFAYCSELEEIDIPNSVKSIGYSAFSCCGKLSNIIIPNSVTTIEGWAFNNCESLSSIEIPDSVTEIGENLFGECTGLASIIVGINNPKYDSRENCNGIIETSSNVLIAGCKKTIIPDSVIEIGECAFFDCTPLESLHIPQKVTKIGNYAFYNCKSLRDINIPDTIISIGEYGFNGCHNLESIDIPQSVIEIGPKAFNGCFSLSRMKLHYQCLSNISIPNDVFDTDVYENCTIIVPPGTKWEYRHHPVFGNFTNIEIGQMNRGIE